MEIEESNELSKWLNLLNRRDRSAARCAQFLRKASLACIAATTALSGIWNRWGRIESHRTVIQKPHPAD